MQTRTIKLNNLELNIIHAALSDYYHKLNSIKNDKEEDFKRYAQDVKASRDAKFY